MALGNSITQSDAANYSYRYTLWKKLLDANLEIDFVGSNAVNYGGNPAWPQYKGKSFDADNEGHWGWSADQILYGNTEEPTKGNLSQWLTGYTPDIVLMHLGTNDMFRNQPVDETLDELREVVKQIRDKNSRAAIILAKLIPAYDQKVGHQSANNIKLLNEQIPALAQELNTTTSPVILVDQFSGFDATTGTDTWDGIHPNINGEEKMAQRWLDAIMTALTILPVELFAFQGQFVQGKGVELKWKTTSEDGNAYFEVQRTTEAGNFVTIGKREGAGTTQNQSNYTYFDATAPAGNIYYRLRQVDVDGNSSLSKIIHVYAQLTISNLEVYPTRSQGNTVKLSFQLREPSSEAEVYIYTVNGSVVESFKIKGNAPGRVEKEINIQHLQGSGLYFVKARVGEQQLQSSFLIDR